MNSSKGTCGHICSGNCRREGCNCNCGEFHTPTPDWREEAIEEMKSRYPKEVNIEGFEPALTQDILEIIARTQHQTTQKIIEEIEKYQANAGTHVTKDCKTIYSGCTECSKVQMASDILAVIRATLPQEK